MVAHKQRASTVYPNAKTRQTDIRGKSTAREVGERPGGGQTSGDEESLPIFTMPFDQGIG